MQHMYNTISDMYVSKPGVDSFLKNRYCHSGLYYAARDIWESLMIFMIPWQLTDSWMSASGISSGAAFLRSSAGIPLTQEACAKCWKSSAHSLNLNLSTYGTTFVSQISLFSEPRLEVWSVYLLRICNLSLHSTVSYLDDIIAGPTKILNGKACCIGGKAMNKFEVLPSGFLIVDVFFLLLTRQLFIAFV